MEPIPSRSRTALLVALPLLVVVAPVLAGRSFFQRDLQAFTYPMKQILRDRLGAGEIPLWTPLLGLGRPSLGLVQPGVLDPLNVLLFLPWPLGIDLFNLAHLPLGALGLRAWLRTEDVDTFDATLGGLLFALSGYIVSILATNGAYAWGVMWVPWAVAALRRAATATPAPLAAAASALGALALALAFHAGDPMALAFGISLGFLRSIALPASTRARGVACTALAVGLALGLCAVVLLPATEVASVGRAGGVPIAEAAQFSTHPSRLVELAWPHAFGAPFTRGWFVHALYDEGGSALRDPFAASFYLGCLTIPLAFAALTRRERLDRVLLAIAVLSTLLALGRFAPLWAVVFEFVPGARYFRYPEKYAFVTTLSLAVLAARGIAPVIAAPGRALRFALAWSTVLCVGAVAAWLVGPSLAVVLVGNLYHVPAAEAGRALAASATSSAAISLCACGILTAAAMRAWPAARTRLALAGLIALDVTLAAVPLVDTEEAEVYRRVSPIVARVHRGAADPAPVRLYRPVDTILTTRALQPWLDVESLYPNTGGASGIAQLDPIDIFTPPRERTLREALATNLPRLAAIAGARHALVRTGSLAQWPGTPVVETFPFGFTLLAMPAPAPRVYLATRTVIAADATHAAQQLAREVFVPGRDAIIEHIDPLAAQGDCTILHYAPERVEARCTSDGPAWAVLADAFFPGWSATVNGTPAPIVPANVAMRAVRVPRGTSRLVFVYQPRGLRVGAVMASLSLLVCAVLIARGRYSAAASAATAAIS